MRNLFVCLLMAALIAVLPSGAKADDLQSVKSTIDGVSSQAIQTIQDTHSNKLTGEEAKIKFRQILNNAFDIPTIARFTLGRYWRVATPAQQTEYTRLLQAVILNKYADRVLEFSGNKYTIDNARVLNEKDFSVDSTFYPASNPPVAFVWRLRRFGTGFKVIDLSVEGISMSVTHRSDFASVIERNGGNVQSLIDTLRDKEKAQALGN